MNHKRNLIAMLMIGVAVSSAAQDVESVLRSMSRREKIAQIIVQAIDSKASEDEKAACDNLVREGLGGVIVMDDRLQDNIELINHMQSLAKVPMLVTIDGEWGASMRYSEYAYFPRAMQLGALSDKDMVYEVGAAIGKELKELKIFVDFAPVVDINNNPANPVINTRSFGQDREKVASFGSAMMRGMRDNGVYGSAKHFPGHGDTDVDSHKGLPVLNFDRRRLNETELYPFRKLIADGVEMVMVGHLAVPALDPTMTPASISRPIITDLLRKEMGFNGIIITDALEMKGLTRDHSDAPVAAYKAGADILLMPLDAKQTIDNLDAAFESGELDERDLDTKVRRVLGLKQRCSMLGKGYDPMVDTTTLAEKAVRPDSERLIQKISDMTMTVVCGSDKLPVKQRSGKKSLAYVSYNESSDDCAAFDRELSQFFTYDKFTIDPQRGVQGIDSVGKLIKGYKEVIVCFHCGQPVQRSGGAQKFAKVDHGQFEKIASWNKGRRVHAVLMGNPYELDKLPEYNWFTSFTVAYSDTRYNNVAAVRALATGKADGVLPVDAGGLEYGYNHFIEMRELHAILHPSSDISPYCNSFNRSQVRTRRDMASMDDMDIRSYLASTFGFQKNNNILYSTRSGSLSSGVGVPDEVQLYANGVKVDWSYVNGMKIKDIENLYVLKGNEAALYQASGGVVILQLKSAKKN